MHSTIICFNSYNYPYFKTIHNANSKFDLKIKEAFYTDWRKPNLNAQQNDLALTHSLKLPSSLCCFLYLSFAFIFYVSFSLSLTLIIGIFYCLNYPLLLLHFITRNQRTLYQTFFCHPLFSLNLTLITDIFYFLSDFLLSLHFVIVQLVNAFCIST